MQNTLADAATHAVDEARPTESALILPAILDLKAAGPLAAAFLEQRQADIIVDGSAVQRIGGQCLQILLAAQQSWAADECRMHIENPSPELCAGAKLFGAETVLFFSQKELS